MEKAKIEPGTGPFPLLSAYPTIIIGSIVDGQPDFATVAWTGVAASVPPTLTIALQHHRYSLKGIRRNMAFSVNIPSVDQVKETDYCGLYSGVSHNKAQDCHFTVTYGKSENAPFIKQCPLNHACEVIQILNLGSHELIVGKITETHVSKECLTDGKPDVKKLQPIIFTNQGYFALGNFIGEAFRCGKTL